MSILNWLSSLFKSSGQEQPSPQDWLPQAAALKWVEATYPWEQLAVKLRLKPLFWTPYIANTNSMDPVLDTGLNNIFIAGANPDDHKTLIDFLKVGDVAVYRFPADPNKVATAFINHRIVQIGSDSKSKFFRFKGDNNNAVDPWVVRSENIKFISVGVIY